MIEPFTAHYVFALGVALFLGCAHWIISVYETGGTYLYLLGSGYFWLPMVLLSEIIQTFILADFCYYYVKRSMNKTAGMHSKDDDLDLTEFSQESKSGQSSSRQHASRPEAMPLDFVVRPQSKIDPDEIRARAKQVVQDQRRLKELPVHQRGDAVSSLFFQANARMRDPVYGCVGSISYLQNQVSQLQMQLAVAQAEILCFHQLHKQFGDKCHLPMVNGNLAGQQLHPMKTLVLWDQGKATGSVATWSQVTLQFYACLGSNLIL